MTPDLFGLKDRIRGIQAIDHHGTEDKAIRAKFRGHLLEVGRQDLEQAIQVTKLESPDGNRYAAEIVVLQGRELRSILWAVEESERERDMLRRFIEIQADALEKRGCEYDARCFRDALKDIERRALQGGKDGTP